MKSLFLNLSYRRLPYLPVNLLAPLQGDRGFAVVTFCSGNPEDGRRALDIPRDELRHIQQRLAFLVADAIYPTDLLSSFTRWNRWNRNRQEFP